MDVCPTFLISHQAKSHSFWFSNGAHSFSPCKIWSSFQIWNFVFPSPKILAAYPTGYPFRYRQIWDRASLPVPLSSERWSDDTCKLLEAGLISSVLATSPLKSSFSNRSSGIELLMVAKWLFILPLPPEVRLRRFSCHAWRHTAECAMCRFRAVCVGFVWWQYLQRYDWEGIWSVQLFIFLLLVMTDILCYRLCSVPYVEHSCRKLHISHLCSRTCPAPIFEQSILAANIL